MRPDEIVRLFSGHEGTELAKDYLNKEGLLQILEALEFQVEGRIKPDFADLARLHNVIRARRVFTVLEFGIGFSTLAMADALLKNRQDWLSRECKPQIRNSMPFTLHAVDTEKNWIDQAVADLPKHLRNIVQPHLTTVTSGQFRGRCCHFYDSLPNILPDLIYLDGPDPTSVLPSDRSGNCLHWSNRDTVVMAADLLRVEPLLLPGTAILVDGRVANARFLFKHFYRTWSTAYSPFGDITAFELQEVPLGVHNQAALRYCLGSVVDRWDSVLPKVT